MQHSWRNPELVAAELLEDTDLLTPNHDGTPEGYYLDVENVPDLVRRIIELAEGV